MIPILFAYPSTHYLLSEDHPQLVWIALVLILTIRAVLGLVNSAFFVALF